MKEYSYHSSDALIPNVIVGEKKRISKSKKKQPTRAKTYKDPILDGPPLQELARISAEVKDAYDNIIGEVEEKRRA